MKYIEELNIGDVFTAKDNLFILTSDFKKNGSRMGISLSNGLPTWFEPQNTVKLNTIFTTDTDNNIIPITNVNNSSKTASIHQVPSVAHSTRST